MLSLSLLYATDAIGNGSSVVPLWSVGGRFLAGGGEGVIIRENEPSYHKRKYR